MAKFTDVRFPVVWIFIALISFASGLMMPYFEGRSNSWWTIPPLLPADLLPLFLLFISCLVLLSSWVRSIITKKQRIAKGLMFYVGLSFFVLSFTVRPADLFQQGFNHYARTVLTADEWRAIGRVAQEHLKPEEQLPGPDKNLWDETKDRDLWSEFVAATQIHKLDPSLMIIVHPEATDIEWGGALEGHRGVIILTHEGGQFSHVTYIAKDIATFVSAD